MAGTLFPCYHTKYPDLSRQCSFGHPCLRGAGTDGGAAKHYGRTLLKGGLFAHAPVTHNRQVTPETKRRNMPHPQLTSDTVAHPAGQQRYRQSGGRWHAPPNRERDTVRRASAATPCPERSQESNQLKF